MKDTPAGLVIGGLLMALGSFLPWITSGFFSLPGTSGDGMFTLIGGIIVVAVALTKREGPLPGVLMFLIGAGGIFIVWGVFSNVSVDTVSEALGQGPQAGTGLFVAGLGSLITFFAGIGMFRKPVMTPIEKTPAPEAA